MRKANTLKFLLATTLCACLASCAWETLDASFDTAQQAREAGMVEKGWIPEWLPGEATGLREVHNMDSNASELSFVVPRGSRIKLSPDCKPIAYADTEQARIRRGWWPEEGELKGSYVFFQCRADATEFRFVAIRKAGDRVLHWRT